MQEVAGARLILRQTVTRDGERLIEAEVTVVLVNARGQGAPHPGLASATMLDSQPRSRGLTLR